MDKLSKKNRKFFELVNEARLIEFDLSKVKPSSTEKKNLEKHKILTFFHKNIFDKENIEISYILYQKHFICELFIKYILNYYIKVMSGK